MQDPNKAARQTSGTRTGSSRQSAKKLHPISAYKKVVQKLSKMLIRTRWLDLKKDAPVFTTVEQGLLDTIDNLEDLAKSTLEISEYINDALKLLNKALKALYSASILAEDADSLIRIKYLDFVEECREYLNNAADQLPEVNNGS